MNTSKLAIKLATALSVATLFCAAGAARAQAVPAVAPEANPPAVPATTPAAVPPSAETPTATPVITEPAAPVVALPTEPTAAGATKLVPAAMPIESTVVKPLPANTTSLRNDRAAMASGKTERPARADRN